MHLGEVAQPIGEIDDTGFVPDVIARVKDVAGQQLTADWQ